MRHIPAAAGEFVPASHEDPNDPGVLKRVIAGWRDICGGQVMMVNWARLPGGSRFRRHYHEDMQEVFVLVSGRVSMIVDETQVELTAGDTVIVESLEIHEMQNLLESDAEYIVFGVSTLQHGKTVVME